MKVLQAEFVTSAAGPEGWPRDPFGEVAFVGRSNVGKSSMLNRLGDRRALARVSSTPGRTRLLNFFHLEVAGGRGKVSLRFCDLPGYGFAKVSKSERAQWAKMIEGYLKAREQLRAVVVIVDARVGPTEDDRQMLHWLEAYGRPAIVAATKIDKLAKAKRIPRVRQLERELGLPGGVVGFSAEDGTGKDAVWSAILDRVTSAQ